MPETNITVINLQAITLLQWENWFAILVGRNGVSNIILYFKYIIQVK